MIKTILAGAACAVAINAGAFAAPVSFTVNAALPYDPTVDVGGQTLGEAFALSFGLDPSASALPVVLTFDYDTDLVSAQSSDQAAVYANALTGISVSVNDATFVGDVAATNAGGSFGTGAIAVPEGAAIFSPEFGAGFVPPQGVASGNVALVADELPTELLVEDGSIVAPVDFFTFVFGGTDANEFALTVDGGVLGEGTLESVFLIGQGFNDVNLFDGTGLPIDPSFLYDLDDLGVAALGLSFDFANVGPVAITGDLAPIPLPGAFLFLGTGLVALRAGRMMHRRA